MNNGSIFLKEYIHFPTKPIVMTLRILSRFLFNNSLLLLLLLLLLLTLICFANRITQAKLDTCSDLSKF